MKLQKMMIKTEVALRLLYFCCGSLENANPENATGANHKQQDKQIKQEIFVKRFALTITKYSSQNFVTAQGV